MSQYSGNIRDLPVVTGGHFIENSTKKIVFGPDGRFWDDYVMRLFTLEPGAESSIHSHPWCHWFMCIKGEGYFLISRRWRALRLRRAFRTSPKKGKCREASGRPGIDARWLSRGATPRRAPRRSRR